MVSCSPCVGTIKEKVISCNQNPGRLIDLLLNETVCDGSQTLTLSGGVRGGVGFPTASPSPPYPHSLTHMVNSC